MLKAVVAAFNQEKALVWAFSVITNLRMELFEALQQTAHVHIQQMGEAGLLSLRHCRIEMPSSDEGDSR